MTHINKYRHASKAMNDITVTINAHSVAVSAHALYALAKGLGKSTADVDAEVKKIMSNGHSKRYAINHVYNTMI